MSDIFGIEESSAFARALAAGEGIKVRQEQGNVTPYSMKDGSIVIGVPSIYNHDEYMGSLHREVSKQSENMKFFHDVDVEKNELQNACKGIVQAQRTEYHMQGEYQGRDKILADQYAQNCKTNGGITAVVATVAENNVTLAALVAIGNEIRNDWQGYQHCEVSDEVQTEMDRLSFLEEDWLEIDDEEGLGRLLNRIQYEPPPPPEPEKDKGDGDDSGDSESEEGDSGSGDSNKGSGDGEAEGEGEAGEEPEDTEEGDKGSDGGEPKPEEPEGDSSGQDSKDDGDDEQDGKGNPPPDNQVGAGEGSQSLKDMGFQKDPVVDKHMAPEDNRVPYQVDGDDLTEKDLTTEKDYRDQGVRDQIYRFLGSFSLSRKIKKYLISQKQVGYQYGMKRGKICSKNVYRVKTGGPQPPIFKQKLATKIQTDTAMFILGDCSGSMRGDRYITSASCQIAMSEVLQTLDIQHMMMQFSTGGRGRTHYITKKFTERRVSRDILLDRYGSSTIRMGCNADGEAVTAAAQYLAKMPQANKILIVLSDGHPAYNHNSSQFLKDTVSEIEKSKIMDIIGIGIQTTSVREFYTNSKVVNELGGLERVLLSLLKDKIMK